MIRLRALTYARGGRVLVQNADLTLPPRTRIGVVGANGTGKSSLFAVIRGELEPEQGAVELPRGWVIAHVAQDIDAVACSALAFVLQGDVELVELEAKIAALSAASDANEGQALAECYARLDAIDGHRARARAAELLAGLGFTQEELSKPVAEFSGGWRMRLNLARALMTRSDLLLLDEPTNHLDMDAVLWLEAWLLKYPGTLLLITHDRDFLDAVAQHILHLDGQGHLAFYPGNYSAFESQRAERLAAQQTAFEKQQRTIAHLQSYITRFRAKATKAKQAQSRVKALERMERIAAAHVESPFRFRFRDPVGEPRQLLRLEQAQLGYGAKVVIHHVEMSILPQSRIGLLGRNGQGKSTLIKSLAGVLPLLGGGRHAGQHLKVGYFAQHQIDALHRNETALWHLQRCDAQECAHFGRPLTREQDLRNFLGGFDFGGERVNDPVRAFSGGEKARLALALIVWQRPNLLLLDEPTNHLDIEMRQALTEALIDFPGAIVLVAHDRHLLRATCDELWWVHDGVAEPFEGDLDDYRDVARIDRAPREEAAHSARVSRKEERREEAAERQRVAQLRRPIERELRVVEQQMSDQTAERDALTAWLASDEAYDEKNRGKLAESLKRQSELNASIQALEERWLTLQESLEGVR